MSDSSDMYLASARLLHTQEESDIEAGIILDEANDTPGAVIDLGCGHGRHLFGMRNCGRLVVGVDYDSKAAAMASRYAPVLVADFCCLPFPSATFGVAFAWCNAFGCLSEDDFDPFFREVHRILQYGGLFVVQGTDADIASELPTEPVTISFPTGETITEVRSWDSQSRRDRLQRFVQNARQNLSGELSVRYFNRKELTEIMCRHGFGLKNMRSYQSGFVASFRKVL